MQPHTPMLLQPYQPHEIHFAYCYRVYLRWQTKYRRRLLALQSVDKKLVNSLIGPYDIRALEVRASQTELLTIVSLQPYETIAACTGKLKGRISRWLRQQLELTEPTKLLSRGYFACTVGKSRRRDVERYLDKQGEHHGYGDRRLPPIYVTQFDPNPSDDVRLSSPNAVVIARYHLVLSTWRHHGVLGSREGRLITEEWRKRQTELRIAITKVSFVPDHVHVAVRAHPAVSPADIVVGLMNSAQETIPGAMVQAGVDRLWEPSAYVGAYGDLASSQVWKFIENLRLE